MNQNQSLSNHTTQLKSSILSFKTEIKRLLSNPYHSLKNIKRIDSKLDSMIESINLLKQESLIKQTSIEYSSLINPTQIKSSAQEQSKFNYLPLLNQPQNEYFNYVDDVFRKKTKKEDFYYSILRRKESNKKMKEEGEIIRKYDIDINSNSLFQLRKDFESKSMKLKERLGRLSAQRLISRRKEYGYRKNEYDKYDKPIIIKEDFQGGLYEMINRGIIPKNCDLTKAFSRTGNPLRMEVKEKKENEKEIEDKDEEKEKEEEENEKNKENVFLTNVEKQVKQVKNQKDLNKNTNNKVNSINHSQIRYIKVINSLILENKNFLLFKNENLSNWNSIIYLINYLIKLLKVLSIYSAEIDCSRLLLLCQSDKSQVTKTSLLNCISERDVKAKGYLKPEKLLNLLKDSAVITVQRVYKGYALRKKFEIQRKKYGFISKIQSIYRLFRLIKICKTLIVENNEISLCNFNERMKKFKLDWTEIKKSRRVEVHINSLSFTSLHLSSIRKYSQKQNNQLTRLLRLSDPNVTLIYVSPYEIPSDVVSYYFSILQALGIKNFKERLHFIVPETVSTLTISLSLSSHLYYSTNACRKILDIINNRQAYIVPGTPSKIDVKLASYLELPILYNENEFSSTIFSKSGSRRVFELCEFSTPIGEWSIKSREDLFSKLVSLISDYPSINIWLFKTDDDFNGRGVGYIQLDKLKAITELKKDQVRGELSKAKYEISLLSYLKSNLHKKIELPNLEMYQSKEEFIESLVKKNGIIEACPTYLLSGITGSPSISFFIEPNGEVNSIYSYDKISSKDFSLSCAVSPQTSIPHLNIRLIVDKVSSLLYKEEVFGFITLEFITFTDGKKSLFWAIDLKSGLSDVYSHLEFSNILHKLNLEHKESLHEDENNDFHCFSIPFLSSKKISYIKMKSLISHFRQEHLVFDIDSNSGVVFSISDVIQSGAIGLFGKGDSFSKTIQMLENSVNSVKLLTSQYEKVEVDEEDYMSLNEEKEMVERILSIKSYIKNSN